MTADDIARSASALESSLLGVVINMVTRYKHDYVQSQIAPPLESQGIKTLAVIPEDRTLLAPTVSQIASHLAGEFVVGDPDRDDLIERVLIGGNILDWGETYFGRHENKAVIVRGDRPDIQMAALNTSTACLVLTGGHDLNQYIQLQADSQDVPVLVLESDTLTAARAFEELSGQLICPPRWKGPAFPGTSSGARGPGGHDRGSGVALRPSAFRRLTTWTSAPAPNPSLPTFYGIED